MQKLLAIKHDYAYQKGFKAPGWQISIDTMKVLQDLGWWVAVQYANGEMNGDINGPYQPPVLPGLKYYEMLRLDPQKYIPIHGHTWNCCGNGLEELWPLLIRLDKKSEFEFISNYINENSK